MHKISWKSPSNIAFIKYWGKHGNQLPQNASLSMTLEKSFTETSITIEPKKKNNCVDITFKFQGVKNPVFENKIQKYLDSLSTRYSFLLDYTLEIESFNSFPHSAGIASSASAMSALALCIVSIEHRLNGMSTNGIYTETSEIARLGSGSASRSLFKEFVVWGKHSSVKNSSDLYGVELGHSYHNMFKCLNDTILLIDGGQKKVSSSAGHSLMNNHPYANQRFESANQNLTLLLKHMKSGDFEGFSFILEHEALSLHSMMMTANPWYTLLSPNTLVALEKIREFRKKSHVPITFTLDAGPNVHVIYPAEELGKVKPFIEEELLPLCENNKFITDNIGLGPEMLEDGIRL